MRKAITLATITRTLAMAARKIDPVYPGTAVARLEAVHQRLAAIPQSELDGTWPDARRALLRAGGLRDLPNARPGQGYTGHAFNDYNHCTCLRVELPLLSARWRGGLTLLTGRRPRRRPDDDAGRRPGRVERRRFSS